MESKSKQAPALLPSNPGAGLEGNVAFSNDERTWSEPFNVVNSAAAVLTNHGHQILNAETWLEHHDSGFILLPQFVSMRRLERGGVSTTTTMQVHHPVFLPAGLFEYQHSTGDNMEEAIRKGFDQWLQTDFVTLLDMLQQTPRTCTSLKLDFPEKDGQPAYSRRAVLGPEAHFVQNPQVHAARGQQNAQDGEKESHLFCPCCLLTNSFNVFKEKLQGDEVFALRLFAARNETGSPMADCRVNGEDFEQGAEALRQYVSTWPNAGYEIRKQYVVLHTLKEEVC